MRRFKQQLTDAECIQVLKESKRGVLSVMDEGYREEGDQALNIKSVIVFGKISFMEAGQARDNFLIKLCDKFTDDKNYAEKEMAADNLTLMCLELTPDHMTGKLANESQKEAQQYGDRAISQLI